MYLSVGVQRASIKEASIKRVMGKFRKNRREKRRARIDENAWGKKGKEKGKFRMGVGGTAHNYVRVY